VPNRSQGSGSFPQAHVDGAPYRGGRTEVEEGGHVFVPIVKYRFGGPTYMPLEDVMECGKVHCRVAEVFTDLLGRWVRLQWYDAEHDETFEELKLVRHPDGTPVFYTEDRRIRVKSSTTVGGDEGKVA